MVGVSNPEHKLDYFMSIGLWPRQPNADVHGWLKNFLPNEIPFATALLNSILYFPEEIVDQLFLNSFHKLSTHFSQTAPTYSAAQFEWEKFRNAAIITRVTGESPNDSDSGYLFSRRCRQRLRLGEYQLQSPDAAIRLLCQQPTRSLVFVDDLVGSGEQFVATWNRPYEISPKVSLSFSDVSIKHPETPFYYCCVLCTETGRDRLQRECPAVRLSAAHFLSGAYSCLHPESRVWPVELKSGARQFIQQANQRGRIPFKDAHGFQELALAIAFSHGVPDATLGIIHHEGPHWRPLLKRT